MGAATKQANFLIPSDILDDLKKHVAPRQQSRFVAEALRKELNRLRLANVLEESFGAWDDRDHPELNGGVDQFIQDMRTSSRLAGDQ